MLGVFCLVQLKCVLDINLGLRLSQFKVVLYFGLRLPSTELGEYYKKLLVCIQFNFFFFFLNCCSPPLCIASPQKDVICSSLLAIHNNYLEQRSLQLDLCTPTATAVVLVWNETISGNFREEDKITITYKIING